MANGLIPYLFNQANNFGNNLMGMLSFPEQVNQVGNFTNAEPEFVPGAGQGAGPLSMSAAQKYAQDLARFGKGAVTGTVGSVGDIESVGRGIVSALSPQRNGGMIDAFLYGIKQPTFAPTAADVNRAINPYVPSFMAGEATAPQQIGEFVSLGSLLTQIGKRAPNIVRAAEPVLDAAQNVPVGLSVRPMQTPPQSSLGFYSAVEDAALNLQRNAGSGQAFLNDITKGPNVKSEEIKWLGLDEFLRGKKNVTKQEVQDYVANNKVDVKEVRLSDVKPAAVSTEKITDYFDKALTPNGDEAQNIFQFSFTEKGAREPTNFTAYETRSGTVELYDNRGNFIDEYGTLEGARNHVWNESQFAATQAEDKTKFGQYTLPGGENYRELLLTMPTGKELAKVEKVEGKNLWRVGNQEYFSEADAKRAAAVDKRMSGQYKSSHWDEPNVLAHLRVNDRVDADGKKMLLVEEVQSDWHQAGRDKGYIPKDLSKVEMKATVNTSATEPYYEVRTTDGQFVANIVDVPVQAGNEARAVAAAERFLQNRGIPGAVPDAPFKDTWYQLALKRALQYAAENGYDRVGLTTGARQAERYDLSKQVEYIDYRKSADGTFELGVADIHGDAVNLPKTRFTAEELPSVVGKEIADKIIKGEGQSGGGRMTLRGIDLRVGGEGMKKYYDEVYPKFLQKYGKKWDAKMGETTVPIGRSQDASGIPSMYPQQEPIRYIDITPKMRESIKGGQPLFSAAAPIGVGAAAGQEENRQSLMNYLGF